MGADQVTAVVTTRNRLAILRRTLGAILDQRDVPDLRVVVIDEASTDGTSEFLAGVDHPRITVVRNDPPLGLPAARNQAIEMADTEWVAICDDDDIWAPTKTRAQLDAVAALPGARWAIAGCVLVDDDLGLIGHRDAEPGDALSRLLTTNITPTVSGLFLQRSLWDEVGRFDPELRASEDWDFEIRMAAASPMASARGPYVAYRIASGSMSSDTDRMRASFDTVRTRYADLSAQQGVAFDAVEYEEYVAHQEVKARRRWAAARCYARLAWWRRSTRDVVRAASAFVAPTWMDERGDAWAGQRVPEPWRREYQRWIAEVPLLAAPDGTPTPA